MFCRSCGFANPDNVDFCSHCGKSLNENVASPRRSNSSIAPGIAAVLSFIIPGLGHILAGEIGKGLVILLSAVLLATACVLFWIFIIPPLLYLVFWVWQIYDAYKTAEIKQM